MVSAPPKPQGPKRPPRPIQGEMDLLPPHVERYIEAHRSAIYSQKLLEPGWGGQLSDEEALFIQYHLARDDKVAFGWGFRPGQKTRPEDGIRRVAMSGDPDSRTVNMRLARPRKRQN